MKIKKSEWVLAQLKEARDDAMITTRQGNRIPLRFAYRCLYCGEFFSQAGAEEHFGKTRIEHWHGKLMGKDEEIEVGQKELSGD